MNPGARASAWRLFRRDDLCEWDALVAGPSSTGADVPLQLAAAMFSHIFGTRLPGPGANWLKQSLSSCGPIPLNTPILADVMVTRLRPEKQLIDLDCRLWAPGGTPLAEGRALVRLPGGW